MKILLTGSSGFIGTSVLGALTSFSNTVFTSARDPLVLSTPEVNRFFSDFSKPQCLENCEFEDFDVVIHLAARAHFINIKTEDSYAEFRRINTDGTIQLALQAAKSGVKRFVFVSSVNVNGSRSSANRSFSERDAASPEDLTGKAKHEAEIKLKQIAAQTGMEVVIIRPPLVYGPGVKGNFFTMVNWVKKGIPLPLGSVNNQRSLVALENLVDFILLCADSRRSPNAANQTFLISDGEDVSTTELFRKVAKAYGLKSKLLPVPVPAMKAVAKLLGKSAVADRLFGNLQVDSSKARELLGWQPVITMDEQLRKMAESDPS